MSSTRRFLSKSETSTALGISLPTLTRRLADGSIPFVKLGGRVLIPAETLDRLIAAATTQVAR
ncbi:MAG: DNA-binding protein [Spirochaetae bacterium HGW-Spirochaetae-7]|nr:MAG: DNA-binding protein [Spirochaetae bacterium HGW-Spirochaetae-7]